VNLTGDPAYSDQLSTLKAALHPWREDTHDPLLDEALLYDYLLDTQQRLATP